VKVYKISAITLSVKNMEKSCKFYSGIAGFKIVYGGSILLFQDEKGPLSAKTYGGSSWSSVQSKVEHDQRVKGLLNVFGVYDYTDDRMPTATNRRKAASLSILSTRWIHYMIQVSNKYS
jgi:catechol 2,3-dioxygenase-like lactoylglutathione lyase family enzyme